MQGKFVIVRTQMAGVHCGTLVSEEGRQAILKDARRIHRWRGANTLNEAAIHGVSSESYTRISEAVPEIKLTETCELIPCSDKARENLTQSRWLS